MFDWDEIKNIVLSLAVLSLSLCLATSAPLSPTFFVYFSFFGVSVGIGFVLHELAHKFTAHYFGAYARFEVWPLGLLLAVLSGLIGVVFVAHGAVVIYDWVEPLAMFYVALAGPLTNLALTTLFVFLHFTAPFTLGDYELWSFSALVNAWLALFNLLPLPPLDGSKMFVVNKAAWLLIFVIALMTFVVVLGL